MVVVAKVQSYGVVVERMTVGFGETGGVLNAFKERSHSM